MSTSTSPKTFKGWAAMDKAAGEKLSVEPWEFEPQEWTEDDVDIEVECTSICGSCIHTITSGWAGTSYPCIAGHEIVGKVVRAGKNSGHKVGTRVGVGAQGGSCRECEMCKTGLEQFCLKGQIGTYQGKVGNTVKQGGYANYHRCSGHFAIELPAELSSEVAAPMMCGGATLWTPLKMHGAGPGKKVGIVGIGGLGHFGLMWASALGAETFAISHSDSKKQDCEKMGVKPENFIIANDIEATVKEHGGKLDLLIITSFSHEMPLSELYFKLMKPFGTVCFVGMPEQNLKGIHPSSFVMTGLKLTGSCIGSPSQIKEMLDFAVKNNIKSIIETAPMSDINAQLKRQHQGKARYRITLQAGPKSGL